MAEKVVYGNSSLHLVSGVAFLNEEVSVFEAMIEGWSAQQLGGRKLQAITVEQRAHAVRRFQKHATSYPWEWSAAAFDEWMEDLVAIRRLAPTTIRTYQIAIRQFCEFLCSPHYGWVSECEKRFGTHPVQVCHQ